jgi:soluble lytic murein transglycosylase
MNAASARQGPTSSDGLAASPKTGAPDEAVREKAPTELVRLLVSLELYDAARDELLYAQRAGSDTPATNATLAWVYNKLGDYRRGIIVMKRAYPTFMSADAAGLPMELLKVIFPIDYWSLIKRYAPANNLDPYLVAALINQESSFLADARSSANAIGLMQLLPSTGRRYARTLRLKRYSTGSLTRPDVNVQLGTRYFADLVTRLGGVPYALASYNAGPHRLTTWTAERPGLEREEFIDDIPFPETQNYVKKILGTAEDYRRLYGADGGGAAARATAPKDSAGKKVERGSQPSKAKTTGKTKKPPKKTKS